MYSVRFEAALNLAGLQHAGQTRKGTGAPYLIHLVHVAAILQRAGYDEDTQIAGLLHDVVEDTVSSNEDGDRLLAEIRQAFGHPVADAIASVTEPKRDRAGAKLPWRYRKEQYLSQLATGPLMALRVSAGDKLHNLATLSEELTRKGDETWARFKKGPEETYWFYRSVHAEIRRRLREPLVDALESQMRSMGILD